MAVTSLDDDKAKDIVTIDLAGKSSLADHLVIASGTSQRQVVAMAEHLMEKLKAAGMKGLVTEGKDQGDWVVLDAFDVIVHLFRPEVREFYNLEKMWDGPKANTAEAETIG
ncbi:ribosome silencing factor [Terasakiella pusilla]|uniref:ribosome silencing factor n=1 Tax=Terasakiella pusilla TaxID=64973 RepID=UPI003AA912EF